MLNYNYKTEFLSSKKLSHADGLSRLIPTSLELLEDTVIASLQVENELVEVMSNTVKELPVTLDEIKLKAKNDIFIRKMKSCNFEKV